MVTLTTTQATTRNISQITQCTNTECQVNCIGNNSCYGITINCPSSYICKINCDGHNACTMARINGNNHNRLTIYGNEYSIQYATITCPIGDVCSVVCSGDKGCYHSTFNATLSRKLNITVIDGEHTLVDAAMYCPYSLKIGFTSQCYLTVNEDANKAMNNLAIYAVEGGPDIEIKCQKDVWYGTYAEMPDPCDYDNNTRQVVYTNNFCWDAGNEPVMYCSEDYSIYCIWGQQNRLTENSYLEPYECSSGGYWVGMVERLYEFKQRCKDGESICDSYTIITEPPTHHPTYYPSNRPSISPTESPTHAPSHSPITYDPPFSSLKILYIRSYGCDYGTCESQYANYTRFCQQYDFLKYSMDAFAQCCDPSVTLSPTTFTNNPSSATYTPTISPTPYPTYFRRIWSDQNEEYCADTVCKKNYEESIPIFCYRCLYPYNVDVLPSFTEYTNFEVSIKGNNTYRTWENPTEWIYKVTFTINNVSCLYPSISFDFVRLKNLFEDETIEISGFNVDETCGGDSMPNNCNEYDTCFQEQYLGVDSIGVNQNIVITVTQPEQIIGFQDHGCLDRPDIIDAFLTLHCSPHNKTTFSPSPASPTNNPTMSPTFRPTCQSIEYVWNCFNGYDDNETSSCRDYGYDGNGIINMGAGDWVFTKFVNVYNQQIVFEGVGSGSTMFSHKLLNNENKLPIIKCGWEQCYIKFKELRYSASSDILRVEKGGNLMFDDVQFDNTKNLQIVLTGYGSSVRFKNTKFINNENIQINLGENSLAELMNCTFIDNRISGGSLFDVRDSVILFTNCTFVGNQVLNQSSLFNIQTSTDAIFDHCIFINNYGESTMEQNIMHIESNSTDAPATLMIFESYFERNINLHSIILNVGGYFNLEKTIFQNHIDIQHIISSRFSNYISVIAKNQFYNNTCKNIYCVSFLTSDLQIDNISLTQSDLLQFGYAINPAFRSICKPIIEPIFQSTSELVIEPTIEPTSLTSYPTSQPTGSLTTYPTNNPITFPTFTPTHLTINQTIIPTKEVECFTTLYLATVNVSDSIKKINLLNFGKDNGTVTFFPCLRWTATSFQRTSFSNISHTYRFNDTNDLFYGNLECEFDNSQCVIMCESRISCFHSKMVLNALDISQINCIIHAACFQSNIYISSSELSTILCLQKGSCASSTFYVNNVQNFTLECVSEESCKEISINITNTTDATIICYHQHSCDLMTIWSDNKNINFNLHAYNEKLSITVPSNFSFNNIDCDPDHAFLRLDGDSFNYSFQDSVSNLFGGEPPCQDVEFNFFDSQTVPCRMVYEYAQNHHSLEDLRDYMTCYPAIFISEILNVSCFGTLSPTATPTATPTSSPSQPPTIAPTVSPTFSPTQNPTDSGTFGDQWINIIYDIRNLSNHQMAVLTTNITDSLHHIQVFIEESYVYAANKLQARLEYQYFHIVFLSINSLKISKNKKLDAYTLRQVAEKNKIWNSYGRDRNTSNIRLEATIYIYSDQIGHLIITTTSTTHFVENTEFKLKYYFNDVNNEMKFIANPNKKALSISSIPDEWWESLGWFEYEWIYWLLIVLTFLFIVCLILIICCYYKKKANRKRQAQTLPIQNACVLLVAIGEYDEDVDKPDFDGYLKDLNGIERDVRHMETLFVDELNYDVFPKPTYHPQTRWSQDELKQFLDEKADFLEDNIETGKQYDGLVVIISCHGIPNYLCTSDYQKYRKLAVHRTFSLNHPKSRGIPRIVVYDCCQGDDQRETRLEEDDDDDDDDEKTEAGKNINIDGTIATISKCISITDLQHDKDQPWVHGQHNPDFLLGRVEAANQGFQSRLDSRFGSYVIYKFYKKYMENLQNNSWKFMQEIFTEIQDELHKEGKQYPESVWNDRTGYIKFFKNEINEKTNVVELEMTKQDKFGYNTINKTNESDNEEMH